MNGMRHFLDDQVMPLLHKLAPYSQFGPRVEVRQTPRNIVVTAEIPGIEHPEHLKIHVQEHHITISGKIDREEHQEEGYDLFHTERFYGSFTRSVPLPIAVDPEDVQASYRNGLLTVTRKKNTSLQASPVRVEFQQ